MPRAYYNEHDPFAAQWLRNLITRGAIAPGDVDERSIEDVCPDDLRGYNQCHFFAGIGVWSHALRVAGWSDDRHVWTGSPPCQPFSEAGERAGFADERHLWPALFHLISECHPRVLFGEQVEAAIKHSWLDLVQTDLESCGYAVAPVCLPAAGFGAPHGRHRIFFVASKELADTNGKRFTAPAGTRLRSDAQHDVESRGSVGQPMADASGIRLDGGRSPEGAEVQGQCAERSGVQSQPEHAGKLPGGVEGLRRDGPRGVGDTLGTGLEGHTGDVPDGNQSGRIVAGQDGSASTPGFTGGFWADAEWLPFRDSKVRPVEPGTFPLVDGAATRVGDGGAVETENIAGKLKGYGNAIVGPVATEFIRAYVGATA